MYQTFALQIDKNICVKCTYIDFWYFFCQYSKSNGDALQYILCVIHIMLNKYTIEGFFGRFFYKQTKFCWMINWIMQFEYIELHEFYQKIPSYDTHTHTHSEHKYTYAHMQYGEKNKKKKTENSGGSRLCRKKNSNKVKRNGKRNAEQTSHKRWW